MENTVDLTNRSHNTLVGPSDGGLHSDQMSNRTSVPAGSRKQTPALQVAALCWRYNRKGKLRFLMITSRDTGRWIIPKGWTMHNRTDAEAAEREAWEEAGVKGNIQSSKIGIYTYKKRLNNQSTISVAVKVYQLNVKALLKQYPETGQRSSEWMPRRKAAKSVMEPELRKIISNFDPKAS